ncbi:MAG: hypothetical protein ACD_79C00148G0005 [uncultured bacterium]|nr:MAG: hypothetical protein ACD_79C00148G0005 [uncultured bacterium]
MKYHLIMNPSSRSGKGCLMWDYWLNGFKQADKEINISETKSSGDAFQFAKGSVGDCTVVAVGGDGTINEVLDGIIQSKNSQLKMGVLYAGTSPDFCKFHNIPTDPVQSLKVILDNKTKLIDVCKIKFHDVKGNLLDAHFGCSCNIGMGASIARNANLIRRHFGDTLGTAMAVIKTLINYQPVDMKIKIDSSEHLILKKVNNLSIVKNPFLASGLKLNLDIQPADGNMYAFGVHEKNLFQMFCLLPQYYKGNVVTLSDIFKSKCNRIEIDSNSKPVEVEFDGDPRGFLPVQIEILTQTLNLISNLP